MSRPRVQFAKRPIHSMSQAVTAQRRLFPTAKQLMLHGERLAASCDGTEQLTTNRDYIMSLAWRGVERQLLSLDELTRITTYIDSLTRHHHKRLKIEV